MKELAFKTFANTAAAHIAFTLVTLGPELVKPLGMTEIDRAC